MCGICGIWSDNMSKSSLELDAKKKIERMRHRGFQQGIFTADRIALGSKRLPILDIDGSIQPLYNENHSLVLVGHGEIYNHLELREDLEASGHRFSTQGDLECILHLYEDFGEKFASFLHGQFALALWDSKKGNLILARDRMGICPLYYSSNREGFVFCSEIQPMRETPWVDDSIDVNSLSHYLSLCYVPGPKTIYNGVRSLLPGQMLTMQRGKIDVKFFWKPISAPLHIDEATMEENIVSLLTDSVSSRLKCDVDWAVLLSGGIDSSVILSLATRQVRRSIRCFSIGYENSSFDESAQAASVANYFGAELNTITLLPDHFTTNMDAFFMAMDQPLADESAFPLFLLDKEASGSVRVLLSGEGSDEIFGGYETYQAYLVAKTYEKTPGALKTFLRHAAGLLPNSDARVSLSYRIKAFTSNNNQSIAAAHQWWRIAFDENEKLRLFNQDFINQLTQNTTSMFESVFSDSPFETDLGKLMHFDRSLFLVNDLLFKADRMGMAFAVETRFPFLDEKLLDFSTNIPPNLHVQGFLPWQSKALFRKSVKKMLPPKHWRTKKRGFNMPIATFLRGPWSSLLDEYLGESFLKELPFFRSEEVSKTVSRFRTGKDMRIRSLWALLVFAIWYEINRR